MFLVILYNINNKMAVNQTICLYILTNKVTQLSFFQKRLEYILRKFLQNDQIFL